MDTTKTAERVNLEQEVIEYVTAGFTGGLTAPEERHNDTLVDLLSAIVTAEDFETYMQEHVAPYVEDLSDAQLADIAALRARVRPRDRMLALLTPPDDLFGDDYLDEVQAAIFTVFTRELARIAEPTYGKAPEIDRAAQALIDALGAAES